MIKNIPPPLRSGKPNICVLYRRVIPRSANTKNMVFLTPARNTRTGVECVFVPFNKRCGIKLFNTKEEAIYSFSRQKKAHKLKMAPKTYGTVRSFLFPHRVALDRRAYVAEYSYEVCWGYFTQAAQSGRSLTYQQIQCLLNRYVETFGICYDDADFYYRRNLGKIGNHAVIVDFGKKST